MRFRKTVVIASVGLIVALAACGSADTELAERQEAVADVGAQVMPFDLELTTHVFTDTATGGIQDVVADDPTDDANISLIRAHLRDEATKFQAGDFSDPEAIHGPDMPGLTTLKDRYDEIAVDLSSSESGATITYDAGDPALVQAIHDWFQAQTSDHGDHAEHGAS
jgi:hypothetical protein